MEQPLVALWTLACGTLDSKTRIYEHYLLSIRWINDELSHTEMPSLILAKALLMSRKTTKNSKKITAVACFSKKSAQFSPR